MEYRIRDAGAEDLDALQEMEEACFSLPWTREQLCGQLPDEQHEFLVAEAENGDMLGYIGMMAVLDEGYISNVAAAPSARRRGIGRALLKEMLRRAETRRLAFVTLEVRESNEGAIALYAGEGFSVVGRRRNYYEHPREDALLMTKFFS
ncbi:MAG: ribosomal protein S18-alanine N-acetyltransferase [Oscillospiraceae bacterium]|nr:ribosomal protein S18-alanine N-acetyltransferase [Oscillospiraceae bacterium]